MIVGKKGVELLQSHILHWHYSLMPMYKYHTFVSTRPKSSTILYNLTQQASYTPLNKTIGPTNEAPTTMLHYDIKSRTPTPHAVMIIDASMECGKLSTEKAGSRKVKDAYASIYAHNCLITLCNRGLLISRIPSRTSFDGSPDSGMLDLGSSGSLLFSLRRRRIDIAPNVTFKRPSSSTPLGAGCAL